MTLLAVFGAMAGGVQEPVPARRANPIEPIAAILDAFRFYQVVAIADPHGNEQVHAFRLALIRHPEFPRLVNDIVVEFGNARYQQLIDAFVNGGLVRYEALRDVWQNTTQLGAVWDRPIYEEFFRAVRAVNVSVPRERRLRVLLGDPPVDWERGGSQIGKWTRQRRTHAMELIAREVVAKERRALVIYGGGHLFRAGQSLVSLLERATQTRVFTVAAATGTVFEDLLMLQPNATSWPVPSVAAVAGTVLQAKQLSYYDAVLYLGPPSSMSFSRLPSSLCSDALYVKMRLERLALTGDARVNRFKEECAQAKQ